jgi:multicomponent Na+:H+ antiporter subunit E
LVRTLSLGSVLLIAWLLLSGHFEPMMIGFGIASCVVVVIITLRMEVIDHEGHPIHLSWGALTYWPWLMAEIVKANWDVAKRVLAPTPDISPTMVRVHASQKSDLGQVIYANSITLTPGTISVDVGDGVILVHSLTRAGARSLEEGEMDRRVTRMTGEHH